MYFEDLIADFFREEYKNDENNVKSVATQKFDAAFENLDF